MGTPELVAEIRTAASTLSTAADAAQSGDLAATAIAIEDVLFRVESILSRIRLIEPPADHGERLLSQTVVHRMPRRAKPANRIFASIVAGPSACPKSFPRRASCR